jgi:hypothetical protein
MANKKEQPASPFGWVNSMRNFSSKIRRTPASKPAETRYNKDGEVIGGNKIFSRTDSAGMQNFGNKVSAAMNTPKPVAKASAPKGPSIAQKRAAFQSANAPIQAKATKPSVSGMGVAGLTKAAPKSINVTPSRNYTDKEKQINALLMTGKKKDGTMKASAQRKIQRIRKK